MTRCPWCGAHNPHEARWCGQCLQRFDAAGSAPGLTAAPGRAAAPSGPDALEPPPASPEGGAGFPVVPPAPSTGDDAPDTGPHPGGRTGVDTGAFLADGGTVRWRCPACEAVNDLDALVCATCGTALAARDRPEVDWDLAQRRAVLAPGLGHLTAGHTATGWARLLLGAVWLLGALALLMTGGTAALAPALALLVGVGVLWVGSVVDVARLARGGRELLAPRALLWLVVGVLVVVLLTLFARAAPSAL